MTTNKDRPGPALYGTLTALLTPFSADGRAIDWDRWETQLEHQIEAGVDGLVPAGTTGECPTLSFAEHEEVLRRVPAIVGGRVPVIPGVGANSTAESVHLAQVAKESGAAAGLVVVPYYNRPTPNGLVEHFRTVWKESNLPIVLYNIPSRTGTSIDIPTYDRLTAIEGIFAVKEASGNLDLAAHLAARGEVIVLSGDDALTLPMMSIGGSGVISVASNVVPMEMKAMTDAALMDDWKQARNIARQLTPLFRSLFLETNPIPVKCALRLLDRDAGRLRLPMTSAVAGTEQSLRGVLQALGMLGVDLDAYIDPRD